ncbi:MAG: HvfB family MNIO-type RiPP peptide maturase [Burkholderiales bacterium]
MRSCELRSAGLGFRRELLDALKARVPSAIDFFEIAPENWIDFGGAAARDLRAFTERYPFVCHGLSLSIGGPSPLDEMLLKRIKSFMRAHGIRLYTEHLSYCSDDGHLYDLLPIPFTGEAVRYVAARVKRVQEILETRIALENASFYVMAPIAEMDEAAFIRAVIEEADCLLHLDVNNVYVNSVNHRYDPVEFLRGMPTERIVYMHMAGHYTEAADLLVDTHGADVIDPVWALLDQAYALHGVHPTLLERDFNIPPLGELMREVEQIAHIQARHRHARRIRRA